MPLKPQQRAATYADIEALQPHVVGEILFGVLHTHPRPAPRHARAAGGLHAELNSPFDRGHGGPGGWVILIEPEIRLGDFVIVPDLAGWRRERMARLPDAASIQLAPDWACEVLSPSTARLDRTDKLAAYARFEVSHVWLADPIARTLEVLVLTGSKYLIAATFKDAEPVTAPPFEAHTFPLDVLWPDEMA